ncbi:MAG: hypothetical protein P8P30_02065 [Rickettsiales bacterium]|nr:hypothetical protein [Rickettsiales bacterium]
MEIIYGISIVGILLLACKFLPTNTSGNSYEGSVNPSGLQVTNQSEINKSWLRSLQDQISGVPNYTKELKESLSVL